MVTNYLITHGHGELLTRYLEKYKSLVVRENGD